MASVSKELSFLILLILINLNSFKWLMATALDSTDLTLHFASNLTAFSPDTDTGKEVRGGGES